MNRMLFYYKIIIYSPRGAYRTSSPVINQYILMRSLTGRDIFQALVAFLFLSHVLAFNPNAFNPNAYPRKTVKCDAVCRSPTQGQVQIELSTFPMRFLTFGAD